MKEMLIKVLRPFADVCFKFANSVTPGQAAIIYIFVLVVLAVWVLSLKQEKPKKDVETERFVFLKDLRLWAVLILLVQAVIYVIFR